MSWSEIQEFITMMLQSGKVHIVVGFICSFFFGFVLAKLLFSKKSTVEFSSGVPELETDHKEGGRETPAVIRPKERNRELEWRHEKLVLTEQQVVESHRRLSHLIDAGGAADFPQALVYPGNTLYYLSETIREERSILGGDLSRFSLIGERVSKLSENLLMGAGEGLVPPPFTAWRQEGKRCLEKIKEHGEILRNRQGALRGILDGVSDLERATFSARQVDEKFLEEAGLTVEKVGRQLDELSGDGVHDRTATLCKEVLSLLQNPPKDDAHTIDETRFSELQRILAVDSFEGRVLGKAALKRAVAQVKKAFSAVSAKDDETEKVVTGLPSKPKPSPVAIFVDQGETMTDPPSLLPYEEKKRDLTLPVTEKVADAVNEADESSSMVLFCSNKPEWWNSNIYRGQRARAREISQAPDGIKWIGIRRLDTQEQVFCEITKSDLLSTGEGRSSGFNGSNELFYDARHLGLFAESCKGDVETRFTYGGWGFGHKVNGFATETEPGPPQASGWKGEKIPLDTVFEISVFTDLPEGVDEGDVIS